MSATSSSSIAIPRDRPRRRRNPRYSFGRSARRRDRDWTGGVRVAVVVHARSIGGRARARARVRRRAADARLDPRCDVDPSSRSREPRIRGHACLDGRSDPAAMAPATPVASWPGMSDRRRLTRAPQRRPQAAARQPAETAHGTGRSNRCLGFWRAAPRLPPRRPARDVVGTSRADIDEDFHTCSDQTPWS